ncbi:MAG: putative Ntn-hydrolase superfamily protein [Chlamydiales bacterium]|jgi:uncharacterized Ntn-hydrolase superfamily protein
MNVLNARVRKTVLAAGAVAVMTIQAAATWSIVVTDSATGEVCVASATCQANLALKPIVGIIVVGKGAGAAQAIPSSPNNMIIWNRLGNGDSPQEILDRLAQVSGHNVRQYGIVNLTDPAVTFTGGSVGATLGGVTGQQGTLRYAIQGNVLASDTVILESEQTLLNSTGDLGQRVMAAMETARYWGGDGRCSCPGPPTPCDSPPANATHSAYTSFIVLARIGDEDRACGIPGGCAGGNYYLDRRFIGDASDIDPIIGLQMRYDAWRAARIGRVDHLMTKVTPSAPRIVADGSSTVDVTVRLRDIDGNDLTTGGQTLHVRGIGGPQAASVESIIDNGDGTHSFTLRAGMAPGICRFRLVVETSTGSFTLNPPLRIRVDPLTSLHAGYEFVSASEGADVPLVTNAGVAEAGRAYILLASASGTSPGTPFNGQTLPLNQDRLLRFTMMNPSSPLFSGATGQLDATGRAEATMHLSETVLSQFIGGRFDFATVVFGSPDTFTDTAGFAIIP